VKRPKSNMEATSSHGSRPEAIDKHFHVETRRKEGAEENVYTAKILTNLRTARSIHSTRGQEAVGPILEGPNAITSHKATKASPPPQLKCLAKCGSWMPEEVWHAHGERGEVGKGRGGTKRLPSNEALLGKRASAASQAHPKTSSRLVQ
jgi:hypothetical protein